MCRHNVTLPAAAPAAGGRQPGVICVQRPSARRTGATLALALVLRLAWCPALGLALPQARAAEGVVAALVLTIKLEGSDSLDSPGAVFQ